LLELVLRGGRLSRAPVVTGARAGGSSAVVVAAAAPRFSAGGRVDHRIPARRLPHLPSHRATTIATTPASASRHPHWREAGCATRTGAPSAVPPTSSRLWRVTAPTVTGGRSWPASRY